MPSLREITTENRQRAETLTDAEIAHHIAAKAPQSADGALRALDAAYRPTAGFNVGDDLEPLNPIGALLDESYRAIQGYRQALAAEEIEPVVAWIRANALPLPPAPTLNIAKPGSDVPNFSSSDWESAVKFWPMNNAMAALDKALMALIERTIPDPSKHRKLFLLARNAFITKAAMDYNKPAYRKFYRQAIRG